MDLAGLCRDKKTHAQPAEGADNESITCTQDKVLLPLLTFPLTIKLTFEGVAPSCSPTGKP